MTSEQIAELRKLRHDCEGSLPSCECDVPYALGDWDASEEDAALPVLQKLLDEREALLEALKNIQWAGVAGEASHFQTSGCPECEAEGEEERKHRPGCKVVAAIAKAESP